MPALPLAARGHTVGMAATTPAGNGVSDAYAPGEDRPLGGYTALTAAFGAAFTGALVALRASGRGPDGLRTSDLVLGGIATHKLSRLIAKDRVTSFLRAPFTRYEDRAGHGELSEEARGTGLQKAVGELLICPYCLGQWVAAGMGVAFLAAPRTTRFVAGVYTMETLSDLLQLAYSAAEERG
jgi:hypothetical protein